MPSCNARSITRPSTSTCRGSRSGRGRKRDPAIAERIEHTLRRLRDHYAQVATRWQAAGQLDPAADLTNVGGVLLGMVHAFALQRLLIPGTDTEYYLSGVHALLTVSTPTPRAPLRETSGHDSPSSGWAHPRSPGSPRHRRRRQRVVPARIRSPPVSMVAVAQSQVSVRCG
jgi:hypothetical protein